MHGLSPLLALFHAGDVDLDLRRLAAAGGLMPRERDDVALLLLLTGDRDAAVGRLARRTLAAGDAAVVRQVADELGIALGEWPPVEPGPVDPGPAAPGPAAPAAPRTDPDADAEATVESVRMRVQAMSVPERLLLALRGGRPERAVLAGDASKAVALAVLSNPGLHEAEVEGLARLAQVHEDVLRAIAGQRAWVRHYGVVVALIRNPRTPAAISLNLLPRLLDRDLRLASTDRNIPDIVRVTARRKLLAS
ncbi:MAG: hypothetical protein AB7I25_05710 [Vicinamibacterales bacterium]